MCGRYALTITARVLAEEFGITEILPFISRFNIAPTQMAPVIRASESSTGRAAALLQWGLIPFWAKDAKIGNKCINARADGVATNSVFRAAFKRRRCVVPVSGFYEWQAIEGSKVKQPWFIHGANGKLMALAGLWESWKPPAGEPVQSFTIITTDPNDQIRRLHDRMPVILQPEDVAAWLDPAATADTLEPLLVPAADGLLVMYRVGTHVNSPKNDDPGCNKPVDPDSAGEQPSLFS